MDSTRSSLASEGLPHRRRSRRKSSWLRAATRAKDDFSSKYPHAQQARSNLEFIKILGEDSTNIWSFETLTTKIKKSDSPLVLLIGTSQSVNTMNSIMLSRIGIQVCFCHWIQKTKQKKKKKKKKKKKGSQCYFWTCWPTDILTDEEFNINGDM